MAVVISTSTQEKTFEDLDVINVGTNPNCDFVIKSDVDVLLTIQYSLQKCVVMNTFHNDKILFAGEPLGKIDVGSICKINIADTEEFVSIQVVKPFEDDSQVAEETAVEEVKKEPNKLPWKRIALISLLIATAIVCLPNDNKGICFGIMLFLLGWYWGK